MRNRTRRTVAVLAASVTVATGLLAVAPSAPAKTSICNPGCAARAVFKSKPKKERLIVQDKEKDGHSGAAEFQIFDRDLNEWLGLNQAIYWNSRGFGKRPRKYKLPLADGQPVRYRACTGDRDEFESGNGTFFDCGGWRFDNA
jgi:hypothetical protein